jgi:ABC-2 type transport system ATP-binding protein
MHMTTTAPPAELVRVRKRFGNVVALDDLSFEIRPGELVALLGPNGAGKTTAVRLLLGLARADGGTARVFGRDPREPKNRVRTGALLQVGKVPETLRVREHLELFASYYPSPAPLQEIVESAGLRGLEHRLFGELSGGQKQRVLFALAICGNPDLLILDEPTVGLDIDARRAIWEQIRRFVESGRSVLLTTHYLAEADALAQRIIVLDRGRIVAQGSPAEIKGRVAGKSIRCMTALPLDVLRAMRFVTTASKDGAVTELLVTNSESVVRELLACDPALANLEIVSAGLEEAFLNVTAAAHAEVA